MDTTVTPSTYVRNLGPGLMRELADFLDPQDGWKRLAMEVRKATGEPRYTQLHIRRFEGTIQKGKSPTQELLYDWGTTNCTVHDLTDLLVKTDFLAAATLLLPDHITGLFKGCKMKYDSLDEFDENAGQRPALRPTTAVKNVPGREIKSFSMQAQSLLTGKLLTTTAAGFMFILYTEETQSTCPTIPVTELDKQQTIPKQYSRTHPEENDEETGFGIFSFRELQRITRNFNDRPLSEGGNKIGEGGFGVVFLGQIKSEKVAVKKLTTVVDGSLQELKEQFDQEIKTMAKCQHENIMKLLGFSNDGDQFCLVYAYMSNGSLLDRLACLDKTAPLPWNKRSNITIGTAKGIKYLHDNNHVHRDIKSANILLDDQFNPKISDFGLARMTGQNSKTTMTERIVGTTAYMAPEALRGEVTIKADIFSLGVVLLEVISGLSPFDEKRNPALLLDIKDEIEEEEATLEEFVDMKMGDVAFDLLERIYCLASQCLNQMKNKRPTIETVLHTLEDICYSASCS
ncbi:interleukin-1 receptor-associated kinase 4 [Gastrophryne carolinensis]